MFGHLAHHLQQALLTATPTGWHATPEAPLFTRALAKQLGFDPRRDVPLHHRPADGTATCKLAGR